MNNEAIITNETWEGSKEQELYNQAILDAYDIRQKLKKQITRLKDNTEKIIKIREELDKFLGGDWDAE